MAKKRPKVSLAQSVQPQTGDLEKLFATAEDAEQAPGLQLLSVRVDAIQPDAEQPRRIFPEESLQELSDSIKQDGVIQPIEVTEFAPSQYRIVHGERRWRAAKLAGLDTVPAVVRRLEYDTATRLVRQLVENIQREDLNDVDRAAGLLRLRDLMQTELDAEGSSLERQPETTPWAKTITWAKVGKRLGYTRQRIHQLIRLLDLPKVIKEDVRDGKMSERDTRVYQGLQARQQRDLHRARTKKSLTPAEIKLVAQVLKEEPGRTVSQAIRKIRQPKPTTNNEQTFEPSLDLELPGDPAIRDKDDPAFQSLRTQPWTEGTVLPPRQTRPTSIDRLDWVRGHLARIQRQGLSSAEQREILRLLGLIQQDIASLIEAIQFDGDVQED